MPRPMPVKGISSLGSPLPLASCSLKAVSTATSSSTVVGTSRPRFSSHFMLMTGTLQATGRLGMREGRE